MTGKNRAIALAWMLLLGGARLSSPALAQERAEEVGAGVLLALLVQAPLGWWTLRSIGTETFQLVWVAGMIIRLGVVALAAVGLARVYHWDAAALLVTLVATLLALLLVEAATAVREHSRLK